MTKPRQSVSELIALDIDRDLAIPMYRQLYLVLRQAILTRRLGPGAKLPSTRRLARELGIARSTVVAAFDQLTAEGYLTARVGAGSFVEPNLPPPPLGAVERVEEPWLRAVDSRAGAPSGGGENRLLRPFRVGVGALDQFPHAIWGRLYGRHARALSITDMAGGDPAGHVGLREQIAAYLNAVRAARCTADQVIIVSGGQQAIDLATRVLLAPGDTAWVEEPGYNGIKQALDFAGVNVVPVPVDGRGLSIDAAVEAPPAKLVVVTPSHQFPLGHTMSLERRLSLLDWATTNDAWVIEDDYDSDFRYGGRSLAALQGLDRGGRVIYLGTFSKALFPSLRLGYLVVPDDLVDAFLAHRRVLDGHPAVLPQLVLADFMAEGHFAAHVRRMRTLYQERRATFIRALERRMGVGVESGGPVSLMAGEGGMHVILTLPGHVDDRGVAAACLDAGLTVTPLSSYYRGPEPEPGLVLGFAAFEAAALDAAVAKLARVVGKVVAARGG